MNSGRTVRRSCGAHQSDRVVTTSLLASGGREHGPAFGSDGVLASFESASVYPDPLRKISYYDAATGKRLKFLTNNFTLPALTIVQIYKQRWQVELFFKWIKQHLRIKAFYGTSENAVKTQICAGGHCAQTVESGLQLVSDPTDSQPHTFRRKPIPRKRPFHAPFSPLAWTQIWSKTSTN